MSAPDALVIENLCVAYEVGGRDRRVLDTLGLCIGSGEAYGLVGESGCGKSTVALAAVRYLARNGRITGGRILIDGNDLMALSPRALRRLRGHAVSMVYQDPGRALNPSLRVARQMTELFEITEGIASEVARERARDMLRRVQIANPERVLEAYPHELSGGMQQRVIIAMALSTNPSLLILDEPTTGLDATVEAEILDLVSHLRQAFSTAILLISHSLSVIARLCDRVGVLYAGVLVEEGPVGEILAAPRHPYTAGLLRCLPGQGRRKTQGPLDSIAGSLPAPGTIMAGCVYAGRCPLAEALCRAETPPMLDLGGRSSRCHFHERVRDMPVRESMIGNASPGNHAGGGTAEPVLSIRNLSKTYLSGGKRLQAVHDVSLDLRPGETLGLIGESGSGKSTFARLVLGLASPDSGSVITLHGKALPSQARRRQPAQLKSMQMVFQNPGLALNRSHTVRRLIGRALRLTGAGTARERDTRLQALARAVLLTERQLDAKPQRLSGGQKQRVGIARAFAGEPEIIVCDEPTSALDVSVQAAILNLLVDLQAERRVSYIFISHDLGVVNYLSDRVAVLYRGRLLEIGSVEQVFAAPNHPYTEALMSASPAFAGDRPRIRLEADIPDPADRANGCIFQMRCPRKIGPICEEQEPEAVDAGAGHLICCHIPAPILTSLQAEAGPI